MAHIEGVTKAGLVLAAALLACAPARAADPTARPPALQSVIDCRKLTDGAQRLACYDAAVAKMDEAETKGDLVTLDRDQRQAARRQAFGFSMPAFTMFDRGEKPETINKVVETVASVSVTAQGRWVLRMRDGAVWRQIDGEELYKKPHAGSVAEIHKASLGSFMMNIDNQPAIRVHRDN